MLRAPLVGRVRGATVGDVSRRTPAPPSRAWTACAPRGATSARGSVRASHSAPGAPGSGDKAPVAGTSWLLTSIGVTSLAALGYVGYTMVEEDVLARRGIFREDNLTDDAAEAAALAAGAEEVEDSSWQKKLRRAAAKYASTRAGVPVADGDADGAASAARAANPVVFLELEAKGKQLPSGGRVEIELRRDTAPRTAENFRALCTGERGSVKLGPKGRSSSVKLAYAGSPVHRVIPGFMVQGGDIILGNGTSGLSIYGPRFDDETFELKHGEAGAVAMANSGPGTNSSQFYITLGRTPWLDGRHVVFGRVVSGMDVVHAIGELGTESGAPVTAIRVCKAGQVEAKPN